MLNVVISVVNMMSMLINFMLSRFYGNISMALPGGGDTKNSFIRKLRLKAENYRKLGINLGGIKGYIYKSLNTYGIIGIKIVNLERMADCFLILSALCVPTAFIFGTHADFLLGASMSALNYIIAHVCAINEKKLLFIALASEMIGDLMSGEICQTERADKPTVGSGICNLENAGTVRAEACAMCENTAYGAKSDEKNEENATNAVPAAKTGGKDAGINAGNMAELIEDILNNYL